MPFRPSLCRYQLSTRMGVSACDQVRRPRGVFEITVDSKTIGLIKATRRSRRPSRQAPYTPHAGRPALQPRPLVRPGRRRTCQLPLSRSRGLAKVRRVHPQAGPRNRAEATASDHHAGRLARATTRPRAFLVRRRMPPACRAPAPRHPHANYQVRAARLRNALIRQLKLSRRGRPAEAFTAAPGRAGPAWQHPALKRASRHAGIPRATCLREHAYQHAAPAVQLPFRWRSV